MFICCSVFKFFIFIFFNLYYPNQETIYVCILFVALFSSFFQLLMVLAENIILRFRRKKCNFVILTEKSFFSFGGRIRFCGFGRNMQFVVLVKIWFCSFWSKYNFTVLVENMILMKKYDLVFLVRKFDFMVLTENSDLYHDYLFV